MRSSDDCLQARIKVDVGPRQRIIVGQSDLTGTGSLP
jgi:hypothetical protein